MLPAEDKKEMVRKMFDDISPRYDFLNHFLSFGIDRRWRRQLVKMLRQHAPRDILDVATGTGDLALAMAATEASRIMGIDISLQMLAEGERKIKAAGLTSLINFREGDAENIPFPDNSFHAVTVAFGVRNFGDLETGLSEMRRVLIPGGTMYILEFSHPASFPMKHLYRFYSAWFIPLWGRIISGNTQAYRYLPESVAAFPSGRNFLEVLMKVGMRDLSAFPLSQGIATIYRARK